MTGVSVSPGADQLVIVHLQGGNDLVLCLDPRQQREDRVGELVGILCKLWIRYGAMGLITLKHDDVIN